MATITKDDVDNFRFRDYHKMAPTKISDELLEVGTKVATLEGEFTCAEPSRLAIDTNGDVYPIALSVFWASYHLRDGRNPIGPDLLEACEDVADRLRILIEKAKGTP